MKNINLKSTGFAAVPRLNRTQLKSALMRKTGVLSLVIILVLASGCRKMKDDGFYGYGKLTVECESKCHISFGKDDKVNEYDVDSNTGVYYIRYQTKYELNISITPIDRDQNIVMNVFSREEKQIFHNAAKRKLNEVWASRIIIP